MTKKELYKLSVQISGGVLGAFFRTEPFQDMEGSNDRKKARKLVYDTLAPLLLTEEPKPNG